MKTLLIIICRSCNCRSCDCRSCDCRSSECRLSGCRSSGCRSNGCRLSGCRSSGCRSSDPDPRRLIVFVDTFSQRFSSISRGVFFDEFVIFFKKFRSQCRSVLRGRPFLPNTISFKFVYDFTNRSRRYLEFARYLPIQTEYRIISIRDLIAMSFSILEINKENTEGYQSLFASCLSMPY